MGREREEGVEREGKEGRNSTEKRGRTGRREGEFISNTQYTRTCPHLDSLDNTVLQKRSSREGSFQSLQQKQTLTIHTPSQLGAQSCLNGRGCKETPCKELQEDDYSGVNHTRLSISLDTE